MFRSIFLGSVILALVGCAHKIEANAVSSVNVYTTRDAKIPGNYNLVIDDNIKSLTTDVKMGSQACRAHTYSMSVGEPLAQSIRNATRSAFDQAAEVRSGGSLSPEITGTIIYRLEDFRARLNCQQGFWSINCTATTDVGMNVMVRDKDGKVVVNTAASASRTADGEAGAMCDQAGTYVGDAFTKATKEVLERLLERISSSKL
jgi:ABC-type uncharacterized transport system auxiliary subunit